MGKECAIIILLYKAVNNEDEHNNTIKSHSGIMPLNIENYLMAMDQSDFRIIVVYNNNNINSLQSQHTVVTHLFHLWSLGHPIDPTGS